MVYKEELQKMLSQVEKWDQDLPIYLSAKQLLLDVVANRKEPLQHIQMGQPEDKFVGMSDIGNRMYIGASPIEHFIQIKDHKVYFSQPVFELTNLLKALIQNES